MGEHVPTVQMGLHSGKFEECRPHPVTGSINFNNFDNFF